MSQVVSAPVLWDNEGNFLNGSLVGIQSNAAVIGYAQKPAGPSIPNQPLPGSNTVQCLQVKDRTIGSLYLTWTLEQWQQAANTTFASPTTEGNYTTTISGTPSSISSPVLANRIIDQVSLAGTVLDIRTITYTSSTGTIDFGGALSDGVVVEVLYH